MLAGAGLLTAQTVAPQAVERTYGQLKATLGEVNLEITKEIPTIKVAGKGGQRELDACSGEFLQLTSYTNTLGVPPVYAAHNRCGGDVILTWEVGTKFHIEGRSETFEVIEVRNTTKTWATTAELIGLQGEFALQSCFYGENRMQFLGIRTIVQ